MLNFHLNTLVTLLWSFKSVLLVSYLYRSENIPWIIQSSFSYIRYNFTGISKADSLSSSHNEKDKHKIIKYPFFVFPLYFPNARKFHGRPFTLLLLPCRTKSLHYHSQKYRTKGQITCGWWSSCHLTFPLFLNVSWIAPFLSFLFFVTPSIHFPENNKVWKAV